MRILIVGAGAVGGYLGACLTRAGRDVTFLVRSGRAAQLARTGLQVSGARGAFNVSAKTMIADELREPFDIVLVSVKSYAINEAIAQFTPAVGPNSTIIPVLNGMRHMRSLNDGFGTERVLGGYAMFSANLNEEGGVVLNTQFAHLTFGEQVGGLSKRTDTIAELLTVDGFEVHASDAAMQDMWEKWASIAANTSATGLMRAAVGDILSAPGGRRMMLDIVAETCAVAAAAGFALRPPMIEFMVNFFTTEGSTVVASPLRDIERGATTEGELIIGEFADRARALGVQTPLLDLTRCHFGAYEFRRRRERARAQ